MESLAAKIGAGLTTAFLGLAAWLMTTVHTQAVTVGKIETEIEHIESDMGEIKEMQKQVLSIMLEERK